MFGDYFGQRADYSRGMFYAGHRRFLNPDGMSSVEPPLEYKSKRQLREMRMSRESASRNEDKISFQMNFQKKGDHPDGENEPTGKKFRKVANLVRSTITLDHFSSAQKEDWIEQKRAGVKIWVNKQTGEVASECPWDNASTQTPIQRMLKSKSNQQRRMSNGSFGSQVQEVQLGTGSLVYDGAEVQELFKILDSGK